MSQLILDEQLNAQRVLIPIRKWIATRRLSDVRPGEHILDDRVPAILLTIKQATFITIDDWFWQRGLCHSRYCILCFALRNDQQGLIPQLLRTLFRLREFRTRAERMGKVARISQARIEYWQFRVPGLRRLSWDAPN